MCGIAGAYGQLSQNELKNMVKEMGHRGPDYSSYESIDNVHLGHARLSIIDLSSASNQPLWNDDNTACIIFNGEIYNFKALKVLLEKKGYLFNSNGDAEVLLNLYVEYGTGLFEHLNGIFSFAIWDQKKQLLLLARDHFGVKPLYYFQNDEGFYFASEIKSLIQVDSLKKSINYDALLRTLVFLWSPGEDTLLEGVNKVKPSHYMVVEKGRIQQQTRFWSWPDYQVNNLTAEQAATDVYKSLEASVADQLVSDVPVGAFLSGGLDSSLLVAFAKKIGNKNLECFTIDIGNTSNGNDGFADDLPFAKKAAEQGVDGLIHITDMAMLS